MRFLTTLLFCAAVASAQHTVRLAELREAKDHTGQFVLPENLRGDMRFAEERVTEYRAAFETWWRAAARNFVPVETSMRENDARGFQAMALATAVTAELTAKRVLLAEPPRRIFRAWLKEFWRELGWRNCTHRIKERAAR